MSELQDMVFALRIKEKMFKKQGDFSSAACCKAVADFIEALDTALKLS